MKRSAKILKKLYGCDGKQLTPSVEERLCVVEELIKHIIDNELSHIWTMLKLILGGIISILGTLLTILLKR